MKVWVEDNDDNITYYNPQYLEFLIKPVDLIGRQRCCGGRSIVCRKENAGSKDFAAISSLTTIHVDSSGTTQLYNTHSWPSTLYSSFTDDVMWNYLNHSHVIIGPLHS